MNSRKNIWLKIEEVCSLTGDKKETVRRKCKSGKYTAKAQQNGKYKIYSILLTSLPKEIQEKYLENKNFKKDIPLNIIENNSDAYSKAPVWAQKRADKYLELINATKDMTYSQIEIFLKIWNQKYPDNTCCYSSLFRAKKEYELFGIAGLLSKKDHCRKLKLNADYFDYYKSLYLREGAPSANFCWMATLGYAKQKDNIQITEFPTSRTFDRELKRTIPEQAIYLARYKYFP